MVTAEILVEEVKIKPSLSRSLPDIISFWNIAFRSYPPQICATPPPSSSEASCFKETSL